MSHGDSPRSTDRPRAHQAYRTYHICIPEDLPENSDRKILKLVGKIQKLATQRSTPLTGIDKIATILTVVLASTLGAGLGTWTIHEAFTFIPPEYHEHLAFSLWLTILAFALIIFAFDIALREL